MPVVTVAAPAESHYENKVRIARLVSLLSDLNNASSPSD